MSILVWVWIAVFVRRDDVRDDGSDDTMIELVMALVGRSLPVMAWIGLVAL